MEGSSSFWSSPNVPRVRSPQRPAHCAAFPDGPLRVAPAVTAALGSPAGQSPPSSLISHDVVCRHDRVVSSGVHHVHL